jgi:hypothetical protein
MLFDPDRIHSGIVWIPPDPGWERAAAFTGVGRRLVQNLSPSLMA